MENIGFPRDDYFQQWEMVLTSLVKFAVDAFSVSALVRKLTQTVDDVLFVCLLPSLHSFVHRQNFDGSSPLSTQMVQLNKHLKKKLHSPLGHQSHSGS